MAEPSSVETAIRPMLGVGMIVRIPYGTAHFAGILLPEAGSGTVEQGAEASDTQGAANQAASKHHPHVMRAAWAGLQGRRKQAVRAAC